MSKNRGINKPRAVWTAAQEAAVLARYPHEKTKKIAADIGMTFEFSAGQLLPVRWNDGLCPS